MGVRSNLEQQMLSALQDLWTAYNAVKNNSQKFTMEEAKRLLAVESKYVATLSMYHSDPKPK